MGISANEDLDFKSQFYNLQGIHINERKKNFHKLLRSTSPNVSIDQIDIQPRNYQETIFYVDVLIYFKQVDKLIEILKGGNQVLTSKILKQRWFFEEAFKNMSEDDIVNKFFPTLSYSLRMKVLKQLSLTLSEERMDKIFDLVLERYGLFNAKQFLFSCSSNKIVDFLKNNEIELPPKQLKKLFQKDVNLLKVYFEEFKKIKGDDFIDHNFFNYLVWKQPHLFFELGIHMRNNRKMSCNTTRALIRNNRGYFLEHMLDFAWNETALVKEIKEFDKKYLFRFFPDNIDNINQHHCSLKLTSFLLKYPIKKRWELLSQSFKQAYDKEILEHLNKFGEELAMFFPDEIKHKWAEIKYLDSNNLTYIKYYESKKAFKLLKDKINITSDITQRNQFLTELVTVCFRNKDYSTYEAVLQYICIRHRNEERYVRENLLSHIERHIEYDRLTENHWKYINEMIEIQRIRDEQVSIGITTEYLLFLYLKELPLDGPIRQYIRECRRHYSFRLLPRCKEAEKKILTYIAKILPTLQIKRKKSLMCRLISNIVSFNQDLRNDNNLNRNFKSLWIDLNDFAPLVDIIREISLKQGRYDKNDHDVLESFLLYNYFYCQTPLKVIDEDGIFDILNRVTFGYIQRFILQVIKKPLRDNFANKLLEYFFLNIEAKETYVKQDAFSHFLTKEPEVIIKYFSLILSCEVETGDNLLDYDIIKKYSHLELDKRLIKHFADLVLVNSECGNKVKLINALSRIMNTQDFLDLLKDYIPESKKIDLNNDDQKKIYNIQCKLVNSCLNLDEPYILAPFLLHFSQGDYLQANLPVLYKTLYRINEEKASSCIEVLSGRAVSTRKHAVFLSFEVLPLKDAITIYFRHFSQETNISGKKHLFQAVLKFFLKNPLTDLMETVILHMNFIDKNDTEIIDILINSVNLVTNKDRSLFTEKVWNCLDILEQQEVAVVTNRNTLLNIINGHGVSFISRLNENFCENIIRKYFLLFYNHSFSLDEIEDFVVNYLLAYLDEQHFKFIFNIIKNYKDKHWESDDEKKKEAIFNFFNKVYGKIYENDVKFLKLFTSFWHQLFNIYECFVEYTALQLMSLYKENMNLEYFSKEVDKFFQKLISEHGPYISEFLINSIIKLYYNISYDLNLGQYALYLLQSNPSEFNCFVAFRLLKQIKSSEQKEMYHKVLNVLKVVDSSAVRIYCEMLIKGIIYDNISITAHN